MEKFANALAETFMEKYPNVTVQAEFTGSSAGIESVLAGQCDVGDSSRALKDDEKAKGAVENIVAIDGIAVVVDPSNAVDGLSKDDLTGIYDGSITNWKDVGGSDMPIVVVGREAGSGRCLQICKRAGFHRCSYGKSSIYTGFHRIRFPGCSR